MLLLRGPAFAVGRVGEHEVEATGGEFIGGQGGADLDVLRVVALDHHVGFADGIGFVVDFLAVEVDIPVVGGIFLFDKVLGLGEHATATAGRVVHGEGERQILLDGIEHQVGHQLDHFPRGEVLPGLFVVFFVEFADQLFKHIAHAQVGQGRQAVAIRVHRFVGGEVDLGRDELFHHIQ